MKKSHDKPARGSAKEAKSIQVKKKDRSFFDYTDEEKREIIEHAVEAASEMQRETIRHVEKIKKAVALINKASKLKFKCFMPTEVCRAMEFLSDENRCLNCGKKLIQIGPHEWKCSCMSEDVAISIGGE